MYEASNREQFVNLSAAPTNTTEAPTIPDEKRKSKSEAAREFLQTLKAFGWQGWLLVAVVGGLYAPVLW